MESTILLNSLGVSNFKIKGMMFRYSIFAPKLYNFCLSLGFTPGKILPSRAFCSDENQGFPIIMIAKHFGGFPFNHGQVGGIVATDRNLPHAKHGKDMLIIQASHVGFDPESNRFGSYRRLQTEQQETSSSCGKVDAVISWYLSEFHFAQNNIYIEKSSGNYFITIDNQLLDDSREVGVFLQLDKMLLEDTASPVEVYSTSKKYKLSESFINTLDSSYIESLATANNHKLVIGAQLKKAHFYFKKTLAGDIEGHVHLERNLLPKMPVVVTSEVPLLTAAILNTQVEFDRTYRTLIKDTSYKNKKLLLISGINIDISPEAGQRFPLTKFVPWAAFVQDNNGESYILEQQELFDKLNEQPITNPNKINLEDEIEKMINAKEVIISLPDE